MCVHTCTYTYIYIYIPCGPSGPLEGPTGPSTKKSTILRIFEISKICVFSKINVFVENDDRPERS